MFLESHVGILVWVEDHCVRSSIVAAYNPLMPMGLWCAVSAQSQGLSLWFCSSRM